MNRLAARDPSLSLAMIGATLCFASLFVALSAVRFLGNSQKAYGPSGDSSDVSYLSRASTTANSHIFFAGNNLVKLYINGELKTEINNLSLSAYAALQLSDGDVVGLEV